MSEERRRHVTIPLEGEALQYFEACARIRNVALSVLFRRLSASIAADYMVEGVLDDADQLRALEKSDHRYRPARVP